MRRETAKLTQNPCLMCGETLASTKAKQGIIQFSCLHTAYHKRSRIQQKINAEYVRHPWGLEKIAA